MLKKKCNTARWKYLKDLASNMHDNKECKLFWNYVNSKRKRSNDLTVIKMDNGSTLTDEREISECMNEFFASVSLEKTYRIFHHSNRSSQTIVLVFFNAPLMKSPSY